MNKKFLIFASVVLLVSFSAGIFTEITTPAENLNLAAAFPHPAAGIIANIKNDFFTVLAALLFSASVFLSPLIPLMMIGKTFSLGFSAAFILTATKPSAALAFLFAALLPRGLFKIPAYIALGAAGFDTAVFVRRNFRSKTAMKREVTGILKKFILCFLVLAISSILEILLLQGVL